ncbi:PQQ-dependent sugar dehydrogenase [Nibricoccus aquaticus]|uniref:PQQ-dependent sugar dehydrogenase n=1 Tax=Nibricoccus aquaticus TaxID=2576891 RepID=UPI0015868669|nr:PQQ-dependent sugar dehydrogenase [Nibricoccus aquaticus]
MSVHLVRRLLAGVAVAAVAALPSFGQYTAITLPTITAKLEDFAAAPATGATADTYIARVNFLRTQPGDANRLWVNDSSGRLYVLDRDDKEFHTLLNFNGTGTNGGLFAQMYTAGGYSWGLVTFQFHPQYAQVGQPGYGKFYSVHVEVPTTDGAATRLPVTTNFSGFNAAGYTTTSVQAAPGTNTSTAIHCVLIEWQDTDVTDYVFTGTARELLRTEGNSRIHPLGDLAFNPLATTAAHPDWENLYLAHGDGADGEQAADATRHGNPQSLATLGGKILRINVADPDGAGAQRYGVPAGNPFVGMGGVRGEVWAYGFRNPHRFSWDVDPAAPTVARLFVNDIGFHDAEEVNIVVAGGNYGWAEREGLRASTSPIGTTTQALPGNDATFGYTYPVVSYPHSDANNFEFGDAISSGYVYRGAAIPALRGKYVFGDITTARLFYANLADMDAVNDGNPATVAAIGVIDLRWDDPDDSLGAGLLHFDGAETFAGVFSGGFGAVPEDRGLFTVIVDTYRARGGTGGSHLPGGAASTDVGRADVRWAMDASGELFLLSKSDGMIRRLVAGPTAWQVANFNAVELGQPSVSGDAADPDGDGVSNLLEYAFDLNPRVSSAALLPQAVVIDGATKLRLEFERMRSELTYVVEVSTDLVSWNDDVPDNPALDVQTVGNHVTAVYTRGAQVRAFMRVNVVGP